MCCITNKPNVKFCLDIMWIIATVGVCASSFQLYITSGNLVFLVVSIMYMILLITRIICAVMTIIHRNTLDRIINSNNFNSNYQCVETVR